jgi:hypothetical protein
MALYDMSEELWQIHGPNFTAGLVLENGRCTKAAPILRKYVLGRTALEIHNTIVARRWRVWEIKKATPPLYDCD